jgi:hypothetical protein
MFETSETFNKYYIHNIILLTLHILNMIIITFIYSKLVLYMQKSLITLLVYGLFNLVLLYIFTPLDTSTFYQSLHICISIYLSPNLFKEYYNLSN